jgi:hypothetical protein
MPGGAPGRDGQPDDSHPADPYVNRVKMHKRQMYGRAKPDLPRKRILLADGTIRSRNVSLSQGWRDVNNDQRQRHGDRDLRLPNQIARSRGRVRRLESAPRTVLIKCFVAFILPGQEHFRR